MNRDIEDRIFDPTKARYIALRDELLGPAEPLSQPTTTGPIDFATLFDQFTRTKLRNGDISEVTSLKHDALYRKIVVFQGNLATKAGAIAMVNYLRTIQQPITSNGCQDLLRDDRPLEGPESGSKPRPALNGWCDSMPPPTKCSPADLPIESMGLMATQTD